MAQEHDANAGEDEAMDVDERDDVHNLPDIDTPPTTPRPVVELPVQEMDKLSFGDLSETDELLEGSVVEIPLDNDRINEMLDDDTDGSTHNPSPLHMPLISINGDSPLPNSGDTTESNVEHSEL